MSPAELEHAQFVVTLYKWFTRNSNTDMFEPIPFGLLKDRKFIRSCECYLKKRMMNVPLLQAQFQPEYKTSSSTQGLSLGVNTLSMADIYSLQEVFTKLKPVKHKQRMLTSKADRQKYKPRGEDWFDQQTKNPGQLGEPIRIYETKTQLVPAIDPRVKSKPWKQLSRAEMEKKK